LIGRFSQPHCFVGGGWWHDPSILAVTGNGLSVEEPRAWDGWWNEKVVELARLSIAQPDALSVLLTGRGEVRYADLVRRMVKSKGLDFDMTCLKPDSKKEPFKSTMDFKKNLIDAVLLTCTSAEMLTIYEDRSHHVKQFGTFLDTVSRRLSIGYPPRSLNFKVVKVPMVECLLDPAAEVAQVQRMITEHNAAIVAGTAGMAKPMTITKKVSMVFYDIPASDYRRLLGLLPSAVKSQAQSSGRIIIAIGAVPENELLEMGGVGKAVRFRAIEMGSDGGDITAIQVEPVKGSIKVRPRTTKYPLVVLSLRRGVRPMATKDITNWTRLPSDRQLEFSATLKEQSRLDIIESLPDADTRVKRENDAPESDSSAHNGHHRRPSDARDSRNGHRQPANHHSRSYITNGPSSSQWHSPDSRGGGGGDHREYHSPANRGGYAAPRYQQHPRGSQPTRPAGRGYHGQSANGGPRGYSSSARGGGRGDRGGYRGGIAPRGGGVNGRGGGRGGDRGGYAPRGRGGYRSLDDVGAYSGSRDARDSYDY
jgi:hypothetical protein